MADLQLPNGVRPIWIDGVFTSEFERDTLPLLFASDRIFDEYYDALLQKNTHVSVAIEQLKARNVQARQQRAEGLWQDAIDSLAHCVHLRRCVFEETDFQFSAAQKHHILCLLNFATFFLKESRNQEAMLMRCFELFKKAEEAVTEVRNKEDRLFLKAAVHNNFSTYFARRKKYKAASQRAAIGLRSWAALEIHTYDLYFAVQRGSGEAWSNRFEEAFSILKQAVAMAPGGGGEGGPPPEPKHEEDDNQIAPVRFTIQVLNCAVEVNTLSHIALVHNIAVSLIGQRRYKEASTWCAKAMELAAAQSAFLKATHPITILIKTAQDFCDKMSFTTKYTDFRMKPSEIVSEEYRRMQMVVNKAREHQRSTSQQQQRPQSQQQRGKDPRNEQVVSSAVKHPATAKAAEAYFPRSAPRFNRPSAAEALRTYLRNMSYREIIEFGIEGPKKKPKPPPKKKKEEEQEKQHGREEDASPAKSSPPRSSSITPRSSRSTSANTTPRKTPKEKATPRGKEKGNENSQEEQRKKESNENSPEKQKEPQEEEKVIPAEEKNPTTTADDATPKATPREDVEEPQQKGKEEEKEKEATPSPPPPPNANDDKTPEATPRKDEPASEVKEEKKPKEEKRPEEVEKEEAKTPEATPMKAQQDDTFEPESPPNKEGNEGVAVVDNDKTPEASPKSKGGDDNDLTEAETPQQQQPQQANEEGVGNTTPESTPQNKDQTPSATEASPQETTRPEEEEKGEKTNTEDNPQHNTTTTTTNGYDDDGFESEAPSPEEKTRERKKEEEEKEKPPPSPPPPASTDVYDDDGFESETSPQKEDKKKETTDTTNYTEDFDES